MQKLRVIKKTPMKTNKVITLKPDTYLTKKNISLFKEDLIL